MSGFERRIGLADMYGTVAEVTVHDAEGDDEASLHLSLMVGGCGARTMPEPTAARQLAAALLDAADRVEKREDE